MIDNGSIKTARISVESAFVLYRKKFKLISLIMLIVGFAGLAAYIALSTTLELKYGKSPAWADAFLVFAVPFTVGLIFYITIIKADKRDAKNGFSSTCTFYKDCFFYSAEGVAGRAETVKLNYLDAVLRKENQKYCYLYLYKAVQVLAFGKEDLTTAELDTLRKLFRRPVEEGAETVELKKYEQPDEVKNELS